MKAHIGVDTASGLVHTIVTTSGNISDINVAGALLHGDEEVAFGDAGYQGVHRRPEAAMQRGHALGCASPERQVSGSLSAGASGYWGAEVPVPAGRDRSFAAKPQPPRQRGPGIEVKAVVAGDVL
jgi:hypothetical protein